MEDLLANTGFTTVDLIAVVFFLLCWVSYYWIVNHSVWRVKTISYRMSTFRLKWMNNMVHRDPKMADALIQNTLQYGVLFFASTSMLIIGALMAGLGASDEVVAILGDFPFVTNTSRTAWEIKVLLVMFIFTFAFFKFAWSYRLFNYVLIMVGASPDVSVAVAKKNQMIHDGTEYSQSQFERSIRKADQYAVSVGKLHSLGARHFTTGLNSYFFAMAATVWFLDPRLFIAATVWVCIVLYRRAFRSNFMKILVDIDID